jgi:hypothetical protein
LEDKDLTLAFTKKNDKLFDVVFSSLRDPEPSIKKTGLSVISKLLTKFSGTSTHAILKVIEVYLEKNKLYLQQIAYPVMDGKMIDTQVPVKCLQLVQKVVKVLPGLFTKD